MTVTVFGYLAPVVQRLDNAIHRINRYPADTCQQNKPGYPLNSNLSGGWRYPPFEQPGPFLNYTCSIDFDDFVSLFSL